MSETLSAAVPAPLPDRQALCGPVTLRRLVRLGLIYAAIFALAVLLAQTAGDPRWQAFAFGLMVPGGGCFAQAGGTVQGLVHFGAGLIALGVFIAGLFVWFATGNVIAPPALWFLSALAPLLARPEIPPPAAAVVPLVVVALALAVVALSFIKRAGDAAHRRAANQYLQHATLRVEPAVADHDRELSAQDLKLMRFLLDRALQPVEAFEGFEWLDQFQTAAVRYQLNFIGYALSMAQATRLPAFGGYLGTAQRRLIDKQTDHRVWRYWALENLWGNLALDPDPVARENIMFTGFCATQIAMYHAASGRRDYDRPGSFALRHPDGRHYDYDFGALVAALEREQRRSAFGLVACEPNWIYPLCNTIGAAATKSHDRMHKQDRWGARAETFRDRLENEFVDLAGWFVPCRSDYTGIALPIVGGAQPQAMPCFFLNATLPDIALRHWLLLRRELWPAGRSMLDRSKFWKIDTGNYRYSRAAAYAGTALAAVELGDREMAQACLAALDEECPARDEGDGWYRPNASVWAHGVEFLARAGERGAFRTLIESPARSERRILLDDVAYPDVLVASATAADGELSAVLHPGAKPGRQRLGFSGLVPEARYRCEGMEEAEVAADASGLGQAHVLLTGRSEIHLRKMN